MQGFKYLKLFSLNCVIICLSACIGSTNTTSTSKTIQTTGNTSVNNSLLSSNKQNTSATTLDVGLANGKLYENGILLAKSVQPNPGNAISNIITDGTNVFVLSAKDLFVSQIGGSSWQKITPGTQGGALSIAINTFPYNHIISVYNSNGSLYEGHIGNNKNWNTFSNKFYTAWYSGNNNDSNSVMVADGRNLYYTINGGSEIWQESIPSPRTFKSLFTYNDDQITAFVPFTYDSYKILNALLIGTISGRTFLVGFNPNSATNNRYSLINPLITSGESNPTTAVAVIVYGLLYDIFFTQGNILYGNRSDGSKYAASLDDQAIINTLVTPYKNSTKFYIGASDGYVYSIDTAISNEFQPLISTPPDNSPVTSLAIYGNSIYVGTQMGNAFSAPLDGSSGWIPIVTNNLSNGSAINSLNRDVNNNLYIGTESGNIWQYTLEASWNNLGSPTGQSIKKIATFESNIFALTNSSIYSFNSANNSWDQLFNNPSYVYNQIDNFTINTDIYNNLGVFFHNGESVYYYNGTGPGPIYSSQYTMTAMLGGKSCLIGPNDTNPIAQCVYLGTSDGHIIVSAYYYGTMDLGQPTNLPVVSLFTMDDGNLYAINSIGQIYYTQSLNRPNWIPYLINNTLESAETITTVAVNPAGLGTYIGTNLGNIYLLSANTWILQYNYANTSVKSMSLSQRN